MPSRDHDAEASAGPAPEYRPELIVARRVNSFSRQRREVFHSMARQSQIDPPTEGDALFDVIDGGYWDEFQARFELLRLLVSAPERNSPVARLWPVLLETYLVVKTTLDWPPQPLLELGRTLLNCLRPGMIYLGGTDAGRAIPTLLDETGEWSETGRHIMLTQNSLLDAAYLGCVQFRFGDQIATPTQADVERVQADYAADLNRRREHDADYPNQPAQVRRDEEFSSSADSTALSVSKSPPSPCGLGRADPVSLQTVMGLNEKLLELLLERNLDRTFAMEEAFPFASFHDGAAPLGPILELRARRSGQRLGEEQAEEAAHYWQRVRAKVIPPLENEPRARVVRAFYAKMASTQAALLLHHQYHAEAQQIFQIAIEIDPAHPEVVFRYVNLLLAEHRLEAASAVAARAVELDAGNPSLQNLARHLDQLNRG